jgi:hypothetical protein
LAILQTTLDTLLFFVVTHFTYCKLQQVSEYKTVRVVTDGLIGYNFAISEERSFSFEACKNIKMNGIHYEFA